WVLLEGGTVEIRDNRRLWIFLEHYLSASAAENSAIRVPIGGQQLGPLVKRIEDSLLKHGFTTTRTHALSDQIGAYLEEQNRFADFSKRAREIWHSNVPKEEFAQFTRVLLHEIPGRILYPLQLLAAYHLAFAQNAANFSVPGAGKTSIVYGA